MLQRRRAVKADNLYAREAVRLIIHKNVLSNGHVDPNAVLKLPCDINRSQMLASRCSVGMGEGQRNSVYKCNII